MSAVDITSLSETAKRFQKDLKMMPYLTLREELGRLGINLIPGIQNKDVITTFLRKQGIAKPYVSGTVDNSTVGQAIEETLEVKKAYASVKDNIQNYKKTIMGPDTLLGKNKSKKHPWQLVMLQSIVKTFGEDILDALFPAAFDTADKSPMGLFNGFDTIIDLKIAAGDVATGKNNLVNTGTINKTNAWDILKEFWRASHPLMRRANTLLIVPFAISDAYDDHYFAKHASKPEKDDFHRTFLEGSGRKCRIVPSAILGTGDRIILTAPGNFDFGMDTKGDEDFVQVRTPYEDPNDVQFWIQADYGCRIRAVHEKLFQVNEGTPVPLRLSGDYS